METNREVQDWNAELTGSLDKLAAALLGLPGHPDAEVRAAPRWLLQARAIRDERPWVRYVGAGLDVTLVSAATSAAVALGGGGEWFALYILVVVGASLRHDRRLAVFTGLVAMAQDAGLALSLGTPPWSLALQQAVLAGSTAVSVAIVLHAARLRRLSETDRLTGLQNRGAFDDRLRAEWSRAGRYQRPFSVVILDVDHFKHFNDTYGHAAGDAALGAVAAELRRHVRASDVVARYGGEEFAILLPETSGGTALLKAQVVVARMARTPIRIRHDATVCVTLSAGVASWPADAATPADLLERADERLYLAKAGGRNRTAGG